MNSYDCKSVIDHKGKKLTYFNLKKAEKNGLTGTKKLPRSLKVLLENLLRCEDGKTVTKDQIEGFTAWLTSRNSTKDIAFHPARVLMQDFTGVPAMVDLAAMREKIKELGGNPENINPLCPVDLVIDHSVMVDSYGNANSFKQNVDLEFERNHERYVFLKWSQKAFKNFRAVPPGTGICHQVNLEYLAQVAWVDNEKSQVYPDTLVGTDSHTTMVNGLAVLGWGVGGIEAEAAMLGQPITMVIPEVVGVKLTGKLREGVTATDLVLTVTELLRKKKVVGKFVEFYGSGLGELTLADRATISNMAPEYGATCGFFPIDQETLNYLKLSGRDPQQLPLVETYAKEQGLWHDANEELTFTEVLELDLATIVPSIAGPKRPQDRIELGNAKKGFQTAFSDLARGRTVEQMTSAPVEQSDFKVSDGDVVIAAITSCTNTSNPAVMLAAGILAKKARKLGLKSKPWVKTSLAPGSQVVSEYLIAGDYMKALDELGFNLVGYGCTTCIGNSGPLKEEISKAVKTKDLVVCSVLSGNRNFEGRINPDVRGNYLMSPPLVVAYAIAGTVLLDLNKDAIGTGSNGQPVYLKDIWPSTEEVKHAIHSLLSPELFKRRYNDVFTGPKQWQTLKIPTDKVFQWEPDSTYIRKPTFFEEMKSELRPCTDVVNARILAVLGDSITTDHISPAGDIAKDGPAAAYLKARNVEAKDFNSYGARRGNHEVMMRGTFANIRLKNEMVTPKEGGYTKHIPTGQTMSIYDASMKYAETKTPLVVIAGQEYGTGSSRDWAAKGTFLLGVKAVIAESYERIHRSNLIGMGVFPLQFIGGENRKTLTLSGDETITIKGLSHGVKPGMEVHCDITNASGKTRSIKLLARIDTVDEADYLTNGGILQYVLRKLK
ncbi:MAG: aconitate hydratase AcnA [Oligoflexales bacterium]